MTASYLQTRNAFRTAGGGTGSVAAADITDATSAGRALLTAASAAAQRTALTLVAGTDIQAFDTDLQAIAALTSAANKAPYATGAGTWALADFTAVGRAVVGAADAAAQRTALGSVIGTDVQAYRAELALCHLAGTNIASATTTDLSAATGDYVSVTGTVTITAFGTAAAGTERKVRFTGALTLTHNGTALILPGAVDILTVANDIARFISLGSGNWICAGYMRNDGGGISAALPLTRGGTGQITGYAARDALTLKGADIASATTTNLATATGAFVDVTGTVTITGLGTASAGVFRLVRFTGALTLTHNATSLILPGGANITTVANDCAEFVSLGSGNWLCHSYRRQDGGGQTAALPVTRGGTGALTQLLAKVALNQGITTLTDAATIATDCSVNLDFQVTLGGNRTLGNPTNVVAGQRYSWLIIQDGSGNRTLAFGSNFKFPAGYSYTPTVTIAGYDLLVGYAKSSTEILVGFSKEFG